MLHMLVLKGLFELKFQITVELFFILAFKTTTTQKCSVTCWMNQKDKYFGFPAKGTPCFPWSGDTYSRYLSQFYFNDMLNGQKICIAVDSTTAWCQFQNTYKDCMTCETEDKLCLDVRSFTAISIPYKAIQYSWKIKHPNLGTMLVLFTGYKECSHLFYQYCEGCLSIPVELQRTLQRCRIKKSMVFNASFNSLLVENIDFPWVFTYIIISTSEKVYGALQWKNNSIKCSDVLSQFKVKYSVINPVVLVKVTLGNPGGECSQFMEITYRKSKNILTNFSDILSRNTLMKFTMEFCSHFCMRVKIKYKTTATNFTKNFCTFANNHTKPPLILPIRSFYANDRYVVFSSLSTPPSCKVSYKLKLYNTFSNTSEMILNDTNRILISNLEYNNIYTVMIITIAPFESTNNLHSDFDVVEFYTGTVRDIVQLVNGPDLRQDNLVHLNWSLRKECVNVTAYFIIRLEKDANQTCLHLFTFECFNCLSQYIPKLKKEFQQMTCKGKIKTEKFKHTVQNFSYSFSSTLVDLSTTRLIAYAINIRSSQEFLNLPLKNIPRPRRDTSMMKIFAIICAALGILISLILLCCILCCCLRKGCFKIRRFKKKVPQSGLVHVLYMKLYNIERLSSSEFRSTGELPLSRKLTSNLSKSSNISLDAVDEVPPTTETAVVRTRDRHSGRRTHRQKTSGMVAGNSTVLLPTDTFQGKRKSHKSSGGLFPKVKEHIVISSNKTSLKESIPHKPKSKAPVEAIGSGSKKRNVNEEERGSERRFRHKKTSTGNKDIPDTKTIKSDPDKENPNNVPDNNNKDPNKKSTNKDSSKKRTNKDSSKKSSNKDSSKKSSNKDSSKKSTNKDSSIKGPRNVRDKNDTDSEQHNTLRTSLKTRKKSSKVNKH